jgi:hypothetical protein
MLVTESFRSPKEPVRLVLIVRDLQIVSELCPVLAQMDAGSGAGARSTWDAAAASPWLARYSAIVRSRP